MGPREVLNKLKWHPEMKVEKAEITIRHRGASKDRLKIPGNKIVDLGSGFMRVKRGNKEVQIPYHRVLKIDTPEKTIWRDES